MSQRKSLDYSIYFLLNLPCQGDIKKLVEEVVAGGVTLIQLRGKQSTGAELYDVARSIQPILQAHGVGLIMNDRLDVAMAVDADGVHLGRDDLPVSVARQLAPQMVIGASCYGDIERARLQREAGADYLAFGACYVSPTKPQAPVISIDIFEQAKVFACPLVAIGGVTSEHIPSLAARGVSGAAVISALQDAENPRQSAAQFARAWKMARQS